MAVTESQIQLYCKCVYKFVSSLISLSACKKQWSVLAYLLYSYIHDK